MPILKILNIAALAVTAILFSVPAAHAVTLNIINNTPAVNNAIFGLVSSTPYKNQTLNASPTTITLTFSQPVLAEKSYIRVTDSYGTRVDDGELGAGDMTLTAHLPELTPGKYVVKWQAHCRCESGDVVGDSFRFVVK